MSWDRTRIVGRDGGPPQDEASNPPTCILRYERPPTPSSFREQLIGNYAAIRRLCTAHVRPGVVVVAVDAFSGRLRASLWLAAKEGAANSAIIGRHGKVDLWLDDDPGLSLRHLALVLSPLRGRPHVRFRVLDLRTQSAFLDEHGRRYESLAAEGPLFVRCGSYTLFFLVTGAAVSWPEDAHEGWASLPERVYLDEHEVTPKRWKHERIDEPRFSSRDMTEGGRSLADSTVVRRLGGPMRVGAKLLAPNEQPKGVLFIRVGERQLGLELGDQAISAGVLLGRYARCDGTGADVLAVDGISRVHLMLLSIDDEIHAIDTGSSNGTQRLGEAEGFHIASLRPGDVLTLAHGRAELRWRPL